MSKTNWPLLLVLLLSIGIGIFIHPTGDFSLNDDWQYAHVAKTFSETGKVTVDVPVAPSLVLQTIAGGAVIRAFGFSQFNLRLLSFFVGLFILWVLDCILRLGKISERWRFLALLNCVLNPLFLHFQWSFMTELYGCAIQLGGLLIWLRAKQSNSRKGELLAVAIIASSFWVRQFCVLLIPALFIADYFAEKRARDFLKHWAVAAAISVIIIGSYFVWVRQSGNFKPQFALPLAQLVDLDLGLWLAHLYVFPMYFLLLLAPFFVLYLPRYRELVTRVFWKLGSVIYLLICIGVAHRWTIKGFSGYNPKSGFNHLMPYLGNVLTPLGIGPITTTDVYIEDRSHFIYPALVWTGVTIALIILIPTLIFLVREIRARVGRKDFSPAVAVFSAGVAINVVFAIQAYHRAVFDRYFFPAYLMGVLLLPWIFQGKQIRRSWAIVALGVQSILGVYAVLGVHDYFRWSESRWDLVQIADAKGLLAETDGGFEINGLLYYEGIGSVKPDVRKSCGPPEEFFCSKLPVQIAWSVPEGAKQIAERKVDSLLTSFPSLKLIQKLIPASP